MLKLVPLVVLLGATSVAATSAAPLQPPAPEKKQPPATSATKAPTKGAAKPATKASTAASAQAPVPTVRFLVSGDSNAARYRVRERLAGHELDNDAIGQTPKVSGGIVLDQFGKILAAQSGFTADVSLLTSDQKRRDTYVRNRLLVTDTFPTTRFVATEAKGLPSPLPTSGGFQFVLLGDLTVKNVTRPTTWAVTAAATGDRIRGKAITRFTFADFQLTQPKVSVLLSLADTITLEYDFTMTRQKP